MGVFSVSSLGLPSVCCYCVLISDKDTSYIELGSISLPYFTLINSLMAVCHMLCLEVLMGVLVCSTVVEFFPSKCKALGLIPSTSRKEANR
jgi:hypothetical protein